MPKETTQNPAPWFICYKVWVFSVSEYDHTHFGDIIIVAVKLNLQMIAGNSTIDTFSKCSCSLALCHNSKPLDFCLFKTAVEVFPI